MGGYAFILLLLVAAPIGLAMWLIAKVVNASSRIEELSLRLRALETSLARQRTMPEPEAGRETVAPEAASYRSEPLSKPSSATSQAPVLVPETFATLRQAGVSGFAGTPPPLETTQPATPLPPIVTQDPVARSSSLPGVTRRAAPAINWEQFMGVKLFAWIGGLALFLGLAFFVKYSFDNNLVPPELRVAIGFVAGLGLLVGGVLLARKDYKVLAHSLSGTGVVVLYAVTFACRSIYHFEFFGWFPTFLLMVLITCTAFLLSVRLNTLTVAVLGMLGGFLTPILLKTGHDNPLGLFGYIALLNIGLLLVAGNRRWMFLTPLAAAGTVFMEVGWAAKFFTANRYFYGNKILIPLGVVLGFNALYLAAAWKARRRAQRSWWLTGATLGLSAVALAFAGWFLSFDPLAQRPWLIFGFVFAVDLCVTLLAFLHEEAAPAQPIAGLLVFGLLAAWTGESLTNAMLTSALSFYFLFALFQSVFPMAFQRWRGIKVTSWATNVFPSLAILLVLIPIFRFAEVSLAVWPFIFLVDLLAIGLAVMTRSLLPVLVVLALTMAAAGAMIFRIPATLTGLPVSLFVLGAFAVFFMAVGVWLARKLKPGAFAEGLKFGTDLGVPSNIAAQLPAVSGILPFLLLIMVTERLPLANPSPVFGLALLLVVLLLGVAKLFSFDWLPAIALGCVTALECNWHFNHFSAGQPTIALTWYLLFYGVFTGFPFLFLRQFAGKTVPWATAALAGPAQFFLVHRLIAAAFPNDFMGLLPAAFAVVPLASLVVVLKIVPSTGKARMTQLAWFGGVALFFITLIFPIQFDRQWITIGWALEGAALLWLYHRVAHNGLRLTGLGLLAAAFVRLALNPAVLEYHQRTPTPLLNWYLYAYGVTALSLFIAARLLAPPRNRLFGQNVQPIPVAMGVVLTFLLLNIEIADFFSEPGSTLAFQFSGNFARDMTYSIAWALFALALLVIGIIKKARASRYAGLALLSVTLLKLFFHDLAQLGQLYRIGAFIGVAVIAMLASFAYQRFYAVTAKEKGVASEPVLP